MFLKNKNIVFRIRRSKVTDYAALTVFRHRLKNVKSLVRNLRDISMNLAKRLRNNNV